MALSTGPCWSSWIPRATSWPHVQERPTYDSQWLDESPQWRWQTCRTSTESWNEWCLCYRQRFSSLWSPVWWVWHRCNANRQEIIWFEVINFVFTWTLFIGVLNIVPYIVVHLLLFSFLWFRYFPECQYFRTCQFCSCVIVCWSFIVVLVHLFCSLQEKYTDLRSNHQLVLFVAQFTC